MNINAWATEALIEAEPADGPSVRELMDEMRGALELDAGRIGYRRLRLDTPC